MPTLLYSFVLISYECEALESNDLKILVLLSEPLRNSSLVAITELELLINQTVLLLELLNAALSDTLNHRHLQVSLALNLCISNDLASLVSLLLCDPQNQPGWGSNQPS